MPSETAPLIRVGQIWQEVDPRFPDAEHREVRGFTEDGRVILQAVGRSSRAKPSRFNGKSGGYRLISEGVTHAE